MATKIPVPRLGQSEETVTIQSWKVKEGDVIKKGDVLFDVETDKAVLDVESQFEGTVGHEAFTEQPAHLRRDIVGRRLVDHRSHGDGFHLRMHQRTDLITAAVEQQRKKK